MLLHLTSSVRVAASRGRVHTSLTLYLAPPSSKVVTATGIPKTTSQGEPEGEAETDGPQQA